MLVNRRSEIFMIMKFDTGLNTLSRRWAANELRDRVGDSAK